MPLAAKSKRLGAEVTISRLTKRYKDQVAVADVSIDVAAGELLTLLGPSGSGKTTTMMAIAGFVGGYEGEIRVGDHRIDHLAPNLRGIGVVFQSLELFPHMTVADNIAFPLRMRRVRGDEIKRQVAEALELVRLSSFGERLPAQLSGGQQQRVALARAIVFSPPLLLLDEPFGALDRKLREEMQVELKSLHERLGTTIIHVTHDQEEAMAISDRIAVMSTGRLEQIGTPREIYFSPKTRFVADFIGESLFFPAIAGATTGATIALSGIGEVTTFARAPQPLDAGRQVTVMLRPEVIRVLGESETSPNAVVGTVTGHTFVGDRTRYDVTLPTGQVMATLVHNAASIPPIAHGATLRLGWDAQDALVFLD